MSDAAIQTVPDLVSADREALRRMLRYIEGECRRIGAIAAAQHAAQAADSITDAAATPLPMTLRPLH